MRRHTALGALRNRGVSAALCAAAVFGAGTPVAKVLLGTVDPWLLGGLLYAGSGVSLTAIRIARGLPTVRLGKRDLAALLGVIGAGGIADPVLLMYGLSSMPSSGASLLLNAEGVFTALLAWFVFRENYDSRIVLGMAAIVAGAAALTWTPGATLGQSRAAVLVLGACFAWAIDNNLTRKLATHDSMWLASIKGLVAGAVNLLIATAAGRSWPSIATLSAALGLGAVAYRASLTLFVVALRHLGAARTGAYFSTAPFLGAVIALIWLGEQFTLALGVAAALMALGVWLHLSERHSHDHVHPAIEHDHEHLHDEHHAHGHEPPVPVGLRHRHRHTHEAMVHSHHHFPDADHQHEHEENAHQDAAHH
jgi:drug/metabolite transporter (DMT)-like permease